MRNRMIVLSLALMLLAGLFACEKADLNPMTADQAVQLNDDLAADAKNGCYTVDAEFESDLSFTVVIEIGDLKYGPGFGAEPGEGRVGPYLGEWTSVVVQDNTNPNSKGAAHYKLVHKFTITDAESAYLDDYFYTDDKAVCSPAQGLGATCLINDQMTIVGGVGIFENVSGKIKTHGPLYMDQMKLNLHLKGKVCLNAKG